jgi:hypothetical protein
MADIFSKRAFYFVYIFRLDALDADTNRLLLNLSV